MLSKLYTEEQKWPYWIQQQKDYQHNYKKAKNHLKVQIPKTFTESNQIQNDQQQNIQEKDLSSLEELHELDALDMSYMKDNDQSRRAKIVKQLMNQMSTVGFIYLKNVPDYDQQELFKAIKSFHHDIPLEDKDQLKLKHFNKQNINKMHGFFPFVDNDPSHKEFYDMAALLKDVDKDEVKNCVLYEETPWLKNDPENKYLWIRKAFEKDFNLKKKICLELISIIAEGLGKSPNYFEPWFKDSCSSVFRAIHYLPRHDKRAAASDNMNNHDRMLVTPEHSDSGFMTVLDTFNYPGLQVEINGKYKSIKSVPNTLVVNLGQTMQRISGNKIKATQHRVYDIGLERFSCPFFLDPKYSAVVDTDILQSERQLCEDKIFDQKLKENQNLNNNNIIDRNPSINFGQMLCKRMTNLYGEWKGFEIPKEMQLQLDILENIGNNIGIGK